MLKSLVCVGVLLVSSTQAHAESSAVVIALKGEARILKADTKKPLHLHDAVQGGATVSTGALSFVRLVFSDNSTVNIGPSTEMKIQPKTGDAPTLEVLAGEIRAKVTRDVIQKAAAQDGSDLKMIIKTKSSAIGVRGTDFQVMYNPALGVTGLITFEGHVSMAKLESQSTPTAAILSRAAVLVGPGQFSATSPQAPTASPPVKISPAQFNLLKFNPTMQPGTGAPAPAVHASISPIPPGADPKALAPSGSGLASVMGASLGKAEPNTVAAPSEKGIRAGGYVDLHAGLYIPPPAGSAYDPVAGTFIPPASAGTVNPATGTYQPPAGVALNTSTGKFEPSATAGASAPATTAAIAAALNTAVANPTSSASISLDTTMVAAAGGAALPPPPSTTATAGATTATAAPVAAPAVSSDFLTTTVSTGCLTCHDTNVQAVQKATKTSVGFNVTVQ